MAERYERDRYCPKCGSAMRTEYVPEFDRIKRTCLNCEFWLYELPLDAEEVGRGKD